MHPSRNSCFQERRIMEKNKIKYAVIVLAVLIFGLMWYRERAETGQQENEMAGIFESKAESEPESADEKIYVHIVGAVKKPGVYAFDTKPRVIEVVEEAGGFTKNAVKSDINQAEVVEDGSQIVIESGRDKKKASEGKKQSSAREDSEPDDGRVNINTATKEELLGLSGIGEAKAASIITYRETNGKFKKIEDIMNITGIKNGVFDKIKDKIKV